MYFTKLAQLHAQCKPTLTIVCTTERLHAEVIKLRSPKIQQSVNDKNYNFLEYDR